MKKILSVALVAALAASTLAGCGGGKAEETTAAPAKNRGSSRQDRGAGRF